MGLLFSLVRLDRLRYNGKVEKVVRKFNSVQDAADADRRYYRSLTPQQRLDILLEMIAQARDEQDEEAQEFHRVYRIIKRGER